MGKKRMPSQGCTHFKAWVQDRCGTSNRIVPLSHNSQQLRRSSKTKVSVGLCSGNASKEGDYSGKNECKPGVLQQIVSGTKAREKMEPCDRSECIKYASIGSHIQDGDCRSYTKLHLQKGMGCISRSNRRVLPHSYPSKISKSASLSCGRTFVPVQSPTFWYSYSSTRIHPHCQRGKANASKQGHTHPPVPRQLAIASSNTADLHGAVKTTGPVHARTRLGNQLQKIRVNTNSKIRLPGVQVRLNKGQGLTHRKKWLILTAAIEGLNNSLTTTPRIPDVIYRHSGISGEDSPNGQVTHETLPVVSQNPLEVSPVFGQKYSMFRNFEKTSDMVEKPRKCTERLSPSCRSTQFPVVYRCFGQGLGCSFGRPDSQ